MQINQKQINSLIDENGNPKKCPECFGTRKTPARRMDCRKCKGTGQATIEIEKEWVEREVLGVETQEGKFPYRTKIKIQKDNVGDEIIPKLCGNRQLSKQGYCMDCSKFHKLKIISETETTQRLIMVR